MRFSRSFSCILGPLLAALSLVDALPDGDFSIGLHPPVSQDRRTIPNFQVYGVPQILSDRIILTPPAPGNQRVGVWSTLTNPYDEWTSTVEFRTSGPEKKPGGSFHIWYTARGGRSQSGHSMGTDTIYTSKPWEGLALVVDSYEGTGSLRAYLNDGQVDYSQHHRPGSLAFAHCNFDYRNWGVVNTIKLTSSAKAKTLKVEIDGRTCFETDKAHVPKGYYFGVTAATSDPPDSFEMFKFILDPQQKGQPKQENQQQQQQQIKQPKEQQPVVNGQQQHQHHDKLNQQGGGHSGKDKLPHEQDFEEWKNEHGEEDHEASYYKSQEEQFEDLHDRLQAMTHHLSKLQSQLGMIYDKIDQLHHKEESMRAEYHARSVPREQIERIEQKMSAIENLNMQISNVVTNKDYSHHFDNLHETLKEHHANILYSVPDTVSQVLQTGGPKIGLMVGIFVAIQIVLAGAYVVYKRRRNSLPKKYL